jgi:hypothetical protein
MLPKTTFARRRTDLKSVPAGRQSSSLRRGTHSVNHSNVSILLESSIASAPVFHRVGPKPSGRSLELPQFYGAMPQRGSQKPSWLGVRGKPQRYSRPASRVSLDTHSAVSVSSDSADRYSPTDPTPWVRASQTAANGVSAAPRIDETL